MLKVCGAVLLLAGTAGFGFLRALAVHRQYEELLYLKKIILMLKGEICYTLSCMSEVFYRLSQRVKEPYKTVFSQFCSELEKSQGNFQEIWRETVINPLRICVGCGRELDKLEELGETMGYLDKEMQVNYLELFLEQLELSIKERGQQVYYEEKLSRTLGILAGIFLVIILW